MEIQVCKSIGSIPMFVQARNSEHCTVYSEVAISQITRSYFYARIAFVVVFFVLAITNSCFPKSLVDWLESQNYVQKTQAVVMGEERILGKFNFLQLKYADETGQVYADTVFSLKKFISRYTYLTAESRRPVITVYYYVSRPDTIYIYDIDWIFYGLLIFFLFFAIGMLWYLERKGNLPVTSFADVKSLCPVTLIGVVAEVYKEPKVKNLDLMHYTFVWRAEESGNIYVSKTIMHGNSVGAMLKQIPQTMTFNNLNFLDREGCGILIKYRKGDFELVHPKSTAAALKIISRDRKLSSLIQHSA